MSAQLVSKCVMCGSSRIERTTEVTYKSGRKEIVPVCQDCGHFHTANSEYGYLITGLPEQLKDKIDDAIRISLGEDTTKMHIEVVELAD